MTAAEVRKEIASNREPDRAELINSYFHANPGQYAAGDRFHGVPTPTLRQVIRHHRNLSQNQTNGLEAV